jgi:tRNA-splicing ligase RtcB
MCRHDAASQRLLRPSNDGSANDADANVTPRRRDAADSRTEGSMTRPLTIYGVHEENTLTQMQECLKTGNALKGVLCADGHLGYAQPVGGVIAYDKQISISGVGFDIACGNMAIRLDVPYRTLDQRVQTIARDIAGAISFGIGRVNDQPVQHALFDDAEAWRLSGMEDYRPKAQSQLGTVGSGNHYVDLLADEDGFTWIGVHFGSRGLGHTTATRYLKEAGGQDGIHVAPTVIDETSEIGLHYLSAMELAGRYAYAGREYVCDRVREIIGGRETDRVHNHHNFAWRETHEGNSTWVVRKGATPCWPDQRGFIGGSMGDDCVIIRGVESEQAKASLYSTIHGAGRTFGRREAKRRFTREQMDAWLQRRKVTLIGGDLDESPMAYRRLPEVLSYHADSHIVEHTLRPFAVVMAGSGEFDPFKD